MLHVLSDICRACHQYTSLQLILQVICPRVLAAATAGKGMGTRSYTDKVESATQSHHSHTCVWVQSRLHALISSHRVYALLGNNIHAVVKAMMRQSLKQKHTLWKEAVFYWKCCSEWSLMIHDFEWYEEIIIVHFLDIFASHNDWLLLLGFL